MDRERYVIVSAAHAAAMAAAGGGLVLLHLLNNIDGRRNRRSPIRKFSIRQSQFGVANSDEIYHNGWFRDQFRCTKTSFDRICEMIIGKIGTKYTNRLV